MDEKQIFEKIQECLSGALGVEPDEIQPDNSLIKDLGAESIDFIDIIFRIEKAFDIKIPSGELFPANLLNEEGLVQGGRVTPEGLKVLREKIPYLDLTHFEKNPQVSNLAGHFTVQMILDYVRDRLSKNIEKS
ncbi:MAG: acyl carrier protein [Candidatus Omnitrophica bacterium]|nr:acyl carrier protein [Candidatus Omnitrophota bacterium]